MIAIEAITAIGGLVIPPAFKLIKNIFGKKESPQEALDDIALAKPEVLPDYIKGLAELREASTKWFNRDIVGTPAQWVVNLRGSIRPISVPVCILALIIDKWAGFNLDVGVRAAFTANISSWFSDRIS